LEEKLAFNSKFVLAINVAPNAHFLVLKIKHKIWIGGLLSPRFFTNVSVVESFF
jgi:hypothetical protein